MSRTYAEQLLDHIGRPGVEIDVMRGAANALNQQTAEIERLRAALARYGDKDRMAWAPAELQPTIDRALAQRMERFDSLSVGVAGRVLPAADGKGKALPLPRQPLDFCAQ